MFLARGTKVSSLFSCVVNRDIQSRINPKTLAENIIRVFRDRGCTVEVGPGMTYTTVQELSGRIVGATRFEIDGIVKFTPQSDVDSGVVDDWYAYAWNLTVGETGRIPTDNQSRAGSLFGRCSQAATRQESQGIGGALASFFTFGIAGGEPNYYQVCSQYLVVREFTRNTITNSSVIDRFIADRVVASSDDSLVGSNPTNSTDVSAMASGVYNDAARAVNNALGTGENGVSVNDLKFFAYAGLFMVGTLIVVKVVKEVKSV